MFERESFQGIVFFGHYFDFRRGFIGCFESTTKVQRECQKCILEGVKIDPEGKLLWFSKVARRKYYKNRYFGAWARRGPKYVTKTVVLEDRGPQTAAGSVFFTNFATNASAQGGHAINLVKQSV